MVKRNPYFIRQLSAAAASHGGAVSFPGEVDDWDEKPSEGGPVSPG